jgi:hypothetical protein
MPQTPGFIERMLIERRSIEQALVDLLAEHGRSPNPALARMIQELAAEITERKSAPPASEPGAEPPKMSALFSTVP